MPFFKKTWKYFVFLVVVSASVYFGFQFFEDQDISSPIPKINIARKKPTPTGFYLQELTMPYLLGRSFESSLGAMEVYEKHTNYTSYLTSYNSDGLKINGLLTIPVSQDPSEKFPAIVFVHGYIAPTIYKTTQRYAAYVDYLARNGFVVFKIDLRGHDKSEGEASGAYYSNDYVIDTLNVYSALQNSDFVDPKAVGIWGHSMAGNITFKAFVTKKNVPALVVWAGAGYTYQDLLDYRLNDQSYRPPDTDSARAIRRQRMRDCYGNFDPASWFWQQVPATNYLDGVAGVIQIHHAVDDSVVNVDYSRNLMKVLDKTNIQHELFEYASGGHNIEGTSFNQAMQRTVNFFHKYLK